MSERFWVKVDKRGPDECWPWLGGRFKAGYGMFWTVKSRNFYAHRFVWECTHGTIPEGLCVCHSCDVPSCCNPKHLFLGTKKDNTQDCIKKGRHISVFRPQLTSQEVEYVEKMPLEKGDWKIIGWYFKQHPHSIQRRVRRLRDELAVYLEQSRV